ncbi:DUF1259 domain-containing protein [Bacillus sp. B-jedd]|uniref:DUF1259 domain-containing protein n=1 Tax=Bacillus sp. B-jedd TaxID=1476857 RepID=UPI00051566DE|nr:cytoplasmic protein [Bacillus sp. B-jedd]
MGRREYDRHGNQNFLECFGGCSFDGFEEDFMMVPEVEAESEFGHHHPGKKKHHHQHDHQGGNVGGISMSTCQRLANIIGGAVITSTPACVVQRNRNINATILGRRTRSPLALPFALSFEDNRNGRTLNLGESVVLQEEINPLMTALRKRGIIVTAVHNHWLFDQPRLMYMHWENTGDPFQFARNSFEAAREAGLF